MNTIPSDSPDRKPGLGLEDTWVIIDECDMQPDGPALAWDEKTEEHPAILKALEPDVSCRRRRAG